MTEAIEDLRARLNGQERLILIEAGAGCGKTYELAGAAEAAAAVVAPGREVLLLTHTNAARDEFRRRIGQRRAPIVLQTLDSLACQLVETYAAYLQVPCPLKPEGRGPRQPGFDKVRDLAIKLLRDAPCIARALALRHPTILVDEHQDSSRAQHELVERIASAGPVRLRLFADRLQAIYDFAGDLVPWESMVRKHGASELIHPWRWSDRPDLGEWLATVRARLSAGEPIPLTDTPESVAVEHWTGEAPAPGQLGYATECLNLLYRLRGSPRAVLVRNESHALGLMRRGVAPFFEGGEGTSAEKHLESVLAAEGEPRRLIQLLIEVLVECGAGITADIRQQLEEACEDTGIRLGKKKRIGPLARECEALYRDPSATCWLAALRKMLAIRAEINWKPQRWDPLLALTDRRLRLGDDPVAALRAVVRLRKETLRSPHQFVATIHRVKGREFPHVVIPYLSQSSFPDDDRARRLLYVAMTRATHTLRLMVPSDNPSPLLSL